MGFSRFFIKLRQVVGKQGSNKKNKDRPLDMVDTLVEYSWMLLVFDPNKVENVDVP
jgi:hypothetical protein